MRKCLKFIINHGAFVEEIQRFRELVEPDRSCGISLKVMNDQGSGLVTEAMRRTMNRVRERTGNLDAVPEAGGWRNKARPRTSADLMKPVIETGDIEQCVYRRKPRELRLAFYKGSDGRGVLKYRCCPYCPPDYGHKFSSDATISRRWKERTSRDPFDVTVIAVAY